jgi:hypothetical protein
VGPHWDSTWASHLVAGWEHRWTLSWDRCWVMVLLLGSALGATPGETLGQARRQWGDCGDELGPELGEAWGQHSEEALGNRSVQTRRCHPASHWDSIWRTRWVLHLGTRTSTWETHWVLHWEFNSSGSRAGSPTRVRARQEHLA